MKKLLIAPKPGTEGPLWVGGTLNPLHQSLNRNAGTHILLIKWIRQLTAENLLTAKELSEGLFLGKSISVTVESEELPEGFPLEELMHCGFEILFEHYIREDNLSQDDSRILVPDLELELIAYLAKNPSKVYTITPRQFEKLVAAIFRNHGFDVTLTPETRDGGFDIIAVHRNILTGETINLIECKRYAPQRSVGIGVVQRLLGAVTQRAATKGLIVTTSYFTRDAVAVAEESRNVISLRDQKALLTWLHTIRGGNTCT